MVRLKIRQNNTWMNSEITKMMKERDKIYKRKIKNPNDENLQYEFNKIKNSINNKIKASKKLFYRNQWERAGNNYKKQWKFINKFFKMDTRESPIHPIKIGQNEINNTMEIANNMNQYFTHVGINIIREIDHEIHRRGINHIFDEVRCENVMFVNPTEVAEMREIISDLKQHSAPGHDEITVRDLNILKEDLVEILVSLVNDVITTGIFPEALKIIRITPIFKSGKREALNNYRPISVVSVFSKIIEKILKKRMLSYINKYSLIDEFQYGFLKDSSTLGAAVDFINHISKSLDEKQVVIAVFIDLRKAFDVVSPIILLNKLEKMGFRGVVHNLIESYLLERKQYVKLENNVRSDPLQTITGVPQGSVLGPLIYSLYTLNLKCANLHATYFSFADDTVLVYTGTDQETLQTQINLDISRYQNWLYSNKLKINIEKTKYMVFKQKNKIVDNLDISLNGISIERVSWTKYLGLVVDDKLDWNNHISEMYDKTIPFIAAIFKCRDYLTKKSKMNIYNSFFLSRLRYMLPVWGTCGRTNFNKVQILQNKILKILFNYNRLTSTETLYRELKVSKISIILELEQCKLMHKIVNKKQKSNTKITFCNSIHEHETRIHNNIYQIFTRTNIGLNNAIVNASKTYNILPEYIKNIKRYTKFVKELKIHLISK